MEISLSKVGLLIILATFTGCQPGKSFSKAEKIDEWTINYYLLYNNRKKSHVPAALIASTFIANAPRDQYKTYTYQFSLKDEAVTKRTGFSKKGITYKILYNSDSSELPALPTGLSKLDRAVFNRIIQLSDSLQLKDFRPLLNAKGFIPKIE